MNITVKDIHNRKNLNEGRNYGMGFAFCKDMGDGNFETVQPISACKDYLNDVVHVEATDCPEFSVYGLTSKKKSIFTETHGYLAIKILPYFYGHGVGIYTEEKHNERVKMLNDNIDHLKTLIHYIEETLKVESFTEITRASNDAGIYLFTVPKYWLRSGALISLYSLLVRMGHTYEGVVSPEVYLESYGTREMIDSNLWKKAKPKYEYFVANGPVIVNPHDLVIGEPAKNDAGQYLGASYIIGNPVSAYTIHNNGIIGLTIPNVINGSSS
jgi:hypothetical protein